MCFNYKIAVDFNRKTKQLNDINEATSATGSEWDICSNSVSWK